VTPRSNGVPAVFGRRIKRERERRNWTLRDLGATSGVNASTILRVEAGHDLALSNTIAIVTALGLSLDTLLAEAACARCDGMPPTGFICSACGRESAA